MRVSAAALAVLRALVIANVLRLEIAAAAALNAVRAVVGAYAGIVARSLECAGVLYSLKRSLAYSCWRVL